MAEFQTKKNTKKMWHSPLMLFVMLSVLLVFMYNMVGLVEIKHEANNKNTIALREMESIQAREKAIKLTIDKLNTEEGKEEALRDKYHLVKAGEKMVVIVDQEADAETTPAPVAPKKGFLQFFKNLFN